MKINPTLTLLISITGIFILALFSSFSKPLHFNIEDLSFSNLNQKIQISGKVVSIKNYKNSQILTLRSTTSPKAFLNVIIINPKSRTLVRKGSNVIAIGTLQRNKNKYQLLADKIIRTEK